MSKKDDARIWAETEGFPIVANRVGQTHNCFVMTDDPRNILVDAYMALVPDVPAADLDRAHTQIAMLLQGRDVIEFGHEIDGVMHPLWEELDPIVVSDYQTRANLIVTAMMILGWKPSE